MRAKTTYLFCAAALLAALAVPTAAAAPPRLEIPALTAPTFTGSVGSRTTLLGAAPRHLSALSWWGGTYPVPGGEHVSIYISTSYPQADAVAQQWADFFGGLPHGQELSLVKVYIAPLDEVSELCSSDEALGCYGGQTIVAVGDSTAGIPPVKERAHG